ncbi:molybdopterin-guanine dinucleotide biosynthesis protein B [Azomonas agilis]|uniref:Molybdopterin-guanine dinucleotide biosynthesis protein B n=1 Tax=Azomonas agilis TaxID=116849 RepID=A0A562J0X7_9GAMM|nr:molybdopterin-guanine dinucleotide biosynthesis protein B [Azomonas agilis]TWH76783.1 molybdopterin-guanine dinucleotide biosynthesis protein B [Azomonas agilis]
MDFDHSRYDLPLLGIVAYSGTGKTTLIEALLPMLSAQGIRTAVIKHAHHDVDVDTPGKDTHRFRMAGAMPVVLATAKRFAVMMETPDQMDDLDLPLLLDYVLISKPDLVLIEGFKHWPLPKLELHRPELGRPIQAWNDPWIKAVASSEVISVPSGVEVLPLNDVMTIAAWISTWALR